jgi:hypothetical protein
MIERCEMNPLRETVMSAVKLRTIDGGTTTVDGALDTVGARMAMVLLAVVCLAVYGVVRTIGWAIRAR